MKLTTQRLKKLIYEELNKINESRRKTRDYHYGSDSQGRAYASQGQYPPKKPFQPLSDPYPGQTGSMKMKMDMGLRAGENRTMLDRYYPKEIKDAAMSGQVDRWYQVDTLFHLDALKSLFEQLEEDKRLAMDKSISHMEKAGIRNRTEDHFKYARNIISFGKTLYQKNLKFLIAVAMGYDGIEDMMNNAPEHEVKKAFEDNLPTWEASQPKFDEYEQKLEGYRHLALLK